MHLQLHRSSRIRSQVAVLTLLASALFLLVSAPAAHAQATGTTDLDIVVEPLCILYYYSEIDVTLTAAVLGALITDPDATAGTTANGVAHFQADEGTVAATAVAGSDLDATLTAPGDLPAGVDLTDLDLNLLNCWAVRCLASATDDTYDIEIQRGDGVAAPGNIDLDNGGGDSITIVDSAIRNTGGGGFTAEAVALTNIAGGLVNADVGDCQVGLDLTNATLSGTYSSAAGTDFTITLTHN